MNFSFFPLEYIIIIIIVDFIFLSVTIIIEYPILLLSFSVLRVLHIWLLLTYDIKIVYFLLYSILLFIVLIVLHLQFSLLF